MCSEAVVSLLDVPYYKFIYKDIKKVMNVESKGHTKMRFVSRALRYNNDNLRHLSVECTHKNEVHIFEKYWIDISDGGWLDEFCITLPNVEYSVQELKEMEMQLTPVYIIGLNDCRHHVSAILSMCYEI